MYKFEAEKHNLGKQRTFDDAIYLIDCVINNIYEKLLDESRKEIKG